VNRIKRYILIALGILLGVALLTFAMRNGGPANVDFFFGTLELPLWIVILSCLGLGWLVPQLLGLVRWTFVARERKRLLTRINELQGEVVELRNVPLKFSAPPSRGEPSPPAIRVLAERVDIPRERQQLLPAGEEPPVEPEIVTDS